MYCKSNIVNRLFRHVYPQVQDKINLQKMKAPSTSLAHPSQVDIMDLFTRQQFIQQCCVLWRIQVSQDAL